MQSGRGTSRLSSRAWSPGVFTQETHRAVVKVGSSKASLRARWYTWKLGSQLRPLADQHRTSQPSPSFATLTVASRIASPLESSTDPSGLLLWHTPAESGQRCSRNRIPPRLLISHTAATVFLEETRDNMKERDELRYTNIVQSASSMNIWFDILMTCTALKSNPVSASLSR
jgi:hypothetical protein